MEKYKIALGKLDKVHMVAIFLYLVKPKESVEKQGRALSSIFQVRRAVSSNFQLQVTLILRVRLKAYRAQWLLRAKSNGFTVRITGQSRGNCNRSKFMQCNYHLLEI